MTRSDEDNLNQRFSTRVENNQILGYLHKKSSGGEWQKRFFETSGGYLTYYKTHHMTKLLAAIAVPQVGAIRRVGPVEDQRSAGVVFSIDLKDRTYMLRASTEEEAQTWIEFLTDLRDGHLNSRTSNPLNSLNSFSEQSFSLSMAARKSKFQMEPTATATINKSTRFHLCCFSR
ncbi:hypothetical protein EON65_29650 [archaeon]|nr:MAG: hypothetical protein EON65_29650 [archaeon]